MQTQQQLASAERQLAAVPAQQSMQAEAHEQAKQKAVAEESAPLLNQISQLGAELAAAQAQAEAAAHSQAMAEAKAATSEAQASEAESVAQRKWVDEVAGLAKSEAAELADARAAASLADSARQEAEHEAEPLAPCHVDDLTVGDGCTSDGCATVNSPAPRGGAVNSPEPRG